MSVVVPDWLMDEPEETKRGLRQAYEQLFELDFDVLLLAHGQPVVSDGKEALRKFVADITSSGQDAIESLDQFLNEKRNCLNERSL